MPHVAAAVYLRQSLDKDQTKLAVTRQRKDCLALCKQRKWEAVEYVDNDVSATSGKARPAYRRMLTDIAEGKIDALVAWDLDRLYRLPRELEDLIELAEEHRLALATVTGDVDLATDNGRLYARIKGAVARGETERKAARQRAAARQKAERGLPQWKRAFGYIDGPNGPDPDPQTAPLVKQAYGALLAGASTKDLANIFNDAGAYGLNGKPWSRSTVSLFMRKPRNAGLREYRGEIVGKGSWTPLVDESTWHAAQSVLNAPGRQPGRKSVRQHLLTGVLQCGTAGCGGYLSGQWVVQKTGGKPGRPKRGEKPRASTQVAHSITYSCKSCHGVSIREDHVKPLLYRVIGERLARPDAVDLLKAELHDSAEAEALRIETNTLLAQIVAANAEYDDGVIDGNRLAGRIARVEEKLAVLDRRQQDQERLRVFDGLPLGKPTVVAAIARLSPDRFRAVMSVLMAVTVAPVGKGGRTFKEERVLDGIDWKVKV